MPNPYIPRRHSRSTFIFILYLLNQGSGQWTCTFQRYHLKSVGTLLGLKVFDLENIFFTEAARFKYKLKSLLSTSKIVSKRVTELKSVHISIHPIFRKGGILLPSSLAQSLFDGENIFW